MGPPNKQLIKKKVNPRKTTTNKQSGIDGPSRTVKKYDASDFSTNKKTKDMLAIKANPKVKKSVKNMKNTFADDTTAKRKLKNTFADDTTAKRTPKKDTSDFAVNKKKTSTTKTSGSYKIKSGDTMSAIAKRRGTTVAEIMKANPSIKDKNKIFAGKSLKMPSSKGTKKKKIDFSKIVSAAKKSRGKKATT
jgi:LysM repeat protein